MPAWASAPGAAAAQALRRATPAREPGQAGEPGRSAPTGQAGDARQARRPQPPPRQCAKHIWFYNGTLRRPVGLRAAQLHELRRLAAARDQRARRLREPLRRCAIRQRRASGTTTPQALGYLVDDVPAVGAVAQTDAGRVGHVAWVSAVGDGTVTVEEYNYYVAGGYDVRTVPTSDFRYLHLADVAPDAEPGLDAGRLPRPREPAAAPGRRGPHRAAT